MTAPHASCSVFLIKKIIIGGVKVDNIVTVGGHINASINFAMQQNYVPVIRSLVVNNNSEEALENIGLKITFEPEFAKEFTYHIGSIPAKSSAEISPVRISTNTDLLFSLTEKMVGNITIEVLQNGENIFTYQNTIELLACDQWSGLNIMPEMIAAFVTPNHPALSPVIHDASTFLKKWKGDPSFTGYQTNNPNNVKLQMAAIFAALVQQKIVYNDPPASYEIIGQRIRLPHKVLEQKMGTCLDLAVLYAACLEAVGLHPLLFFMTGHAFCGCWLENETFADCCVDDVSAIEKRIAENAEEMLLVECTDFVDSNVHDVERFDHAMKHGKDHISNMEFQCVIDIIRTRGSGIRPIPLRPEQTYSGLQLAEGSDKPKEMLAPSELNSSLLGKVAEGNDKTVTKMRVWERKLLDFSLRNSLLNFRVTKNTMQLMTADLGKLEDELASGSDFRIMEIPTEWTVSTRDAKIFAIENEKDLVTNIAENEFKNNRIRTFLNEADLDTALKSLYRSAKVSMEENGSNTLFLALGLLRWYESDLSEKPRYAPLVLIPIDIVRNTRNKGYIIRSRQEETQINVTLLEYLRQDHGISITGLDPLPLDEHGIDLPLVFNTIRQAVMGKKRWNIEEYAFIGLFSFSQFVMWNDLRNRSEEISQNKVVSSLMAGSLTYAPEDISITPENIDSDLDLENMAVPMSADSSQLAAIAAAGSGQSFVLHGPPGTGKSQTITNMIANALYNDKSVLFVAEKMAALNVVQKRLANLGLDPFCLELHSNKTNKTTVLAELDRKSPEPVFIKNLENVQGDERDVILFSVGYGPDEKGQVSMNFGPLNRDGGWRRLNVAISRARKAMIVYSVLRPEQIDLSRTRSEGVAGLKGFLEFAERGKLAVTAHSTTKSTSDSTVTECIAKAIKELGYGVKCNIGSSEFKVDIGIIDPDNENEYLLGILLDGENTLHSSTAQDRFILQPSVLNGLGWNILRVWTLDWFDDKDRVLKNIKAAIDSAPKHEAETAPPSKPAVYSTSQFEKEEASALTSAFAQPYVTADIGIMGTSDDFYKPENKQKIRETAEKMIAVEAPISEKLFMRKVFTAWGITRSGSRVESIFADAAQGVSPFATADENRVFLWKEGQSPESYSIYRTSDDTNKRSMEDIPSEEIINAVKEVLCQQISLSETDLVRETAKKFGYTRAVGITESVISYTLKKALTAGLIKKSESGNISAK